jgi:hypothetical protein
MTRSISLQGFVIYELWLVAARRNHNFKTMIKCIFYCLKTTLKARWLQAVHGHLEQISVSQSKIFSPYLPFHTLSL